MTKAFEHPGRRVSACFVVMVALGAGLAGPLTADVDVECGLRCLYVASVALGHEGGYEELRGFAPRPASDNGYSLAQLRDVAEELGFDTALVETSYERLVARARSQPFACIGWLNDGHFVLLADFQDGRVLVVDPPRQRWADELVFRRRWSGESLLLSTQPLLPEGALVQSNWKHIGLFLLLALVAAASALAFFYGRGRSWSFLAWR